MSSLVETSTSTNKKNSTKGLLLQYLLFKSLGPTKHHYAHLHDDQRWEIYSKAINSLTLNDSPLRIANVGAGWGLLSSLVCTKYQHDQAEIITVERLRPVANAVREFINVNEIQKWENPKLTSAVISNMEEDDTRCDLILLDIMAPCLYEPTNTGDLTSGLMATLRSLHHNVSAATKFMPRAAKLYGCLVNIPPRPCVPALSLPLTNNVCGVHISAFNSFRQPPSGFDAVPMTAVEHTRLSLPFLIDHLDFNQIAREAQEEQEGEVPGEGKKHAFISSIDNVQCIETGKCNGLLIWNELDTGENWNDSSKIISSAPESSIFNNETKKCQRRQGIILLDSIDIKTMEQGHVMRVRLERDVDVGHVRYFDCIPSSSNVTETKTASTASTASPASTSEALPPLQGPRKVPSTVSRWHFSMLLDNDRNSKYQQAIAKAVKKLGPEDLVLDIGTGTGLLACFAAQSGAKKVIGCEANAPIAKVAYNIVKRNGLDEQIRIVLRHSTDLVIGQEKLKDSEDDELFTTIDRKASLLVSEILDCGLLGEQVLPVVKHARQHLLKEGAVAIPARARVKGILVDLTSSGAIAVSRPCDSIGPKNGKRNGSTFNKFLRWNTWEQIRLQDMPHVQLSEPFDIVNVDLRGYKEDKAEKRKRLGTTSMITCIAPGTVSAVVMYFDMDLDEEGEFMISTAPSNVESCWSQAIQLLAGENEEEPKVVVVGEEIEIECSYNDDRVKVELG